MTDIIDRVAENEAIFLAEALHKARQHSEHTVSAEFCEDCTDPIPEARRQAVPGCTRCFACQEYFEHGFP